MAEQVRAAEGFSVEEWEAAARAVSAAAENWDRNPEIEEGDALAEAVVSEIRMA